LAGRGRRRMVVGGGTARHLLPPPLAEAGFRREHARARERARARVPAPCAPRTPPRLPGLEHLACAREQAASGRPGARIRRAHCASSAPLRRARAIDKPGRAWQEHRLRVVSASLSRALPHLHQLHLLAAPQVDVVQAHVEHVGRHDGRRAPQQRGRHGRLGRERKRPAERPTGHSLLHRERVQRARCGWVGGWVGGRGQYFRAAACVRGTLVRSVSRLSRAKGSKPKEERARQQARVSLIATKGARPLCSHRFAHTHKHAHSRPPASRYPRNPRRRPTAHRAPRAPTLEEQPTRSPCARPRSRMLACASRRLFARSAVPLHHCRLAPLARPFGELGVCSRRPPPPPSSSAAAGERAF